MVEKGAMTDQLALGGPRKASTSDVEGVGVALSTDVRVSRPSSRVTCAPADAGDAERMDQAARAGGLDAGAGRQASGEDDQAGSAADHPAREQAPGLLEGLRGRRSAAKPAYRTVRVDPISMMRMMSERRPFNVSVRLED